MSSARVSRSINAPRSAVYHALVDARAVQAWMVPTGMSSHVHEFDPREDGTFRTAHDALPPGLSPADNELGWQSSLGKLAALVEAERSR